MTNLIEQLTLLIPWTFLHEIPAWVVAAAPAIAAALTWHVSLLKHRADRENADREWRLKLQAQRRKWDDEEKGRQANERQAVHVEHAEQTRAWTERFEKLMTGYDARVDDLTTEVISLRSEVVSLRKIIDWQRQACTGCPKLAQFVTEHPSATC